MLLDFKQTLDALGGSYPVSERLVLRSCPVHKTRRRRIHHRPSSPLLTSDQKKVPAHPAEVSGKMTPSSSSSHRVSALPASPANRARASSHRRRRILHGAASAKAATPLQVGVVHVATQPDWLCLHTCTHPRVLKRRLRKSRRRDGFLIPLIWLHDGFSYSGGPANIPICSKQEITGNLSQSRFEGEREKKK